MATYSYLPGVQVTTLDGGYATTNVPSARATLIIGTAGTGPANEPYIVTNRATAAQVFGLSGSLIRACEEVASGGSDNITLFRMGTVPAQLNGVGLDNTPNNTTPGFNITLNEIATTTGTDFKVWYKTGVLYVYLNGQLVYSNDVANGTATDLQEITLTGNPAGNNGLALGTGNVGSYANAVTLTAAAALAGTTDQPAPTFLAPNTGLALTGRQTYIAISQALDLLAMFPTDQVYCPDAQLDAPNVAYYNTGNLASSINNPAINPNALDWLSVTTLNGAATVYQWASETVDSNGNNVSAMTAQTAEDRISQGFFETNYASLIGNYCRNQEYVGLSGNCIGFIGTSAPNSYGLVDTRKWIGYLPTYSGVNPTQAVAPGAGLLGLPILTGTSAGGLNPLTKDYATGYRTGGIFLTDNGLYDGVVQFDANGNPIDVGAYLHCVADYGITSNGWATNYVANLAGIVAGFHSTLDQMVALTNKPVNVIQLWKPNFTQMDSLTFAGINVLRYKGNNTLPCLLHGDTLANQNSDYINLLRQMIKGLVVSTIRSVSDSFIGYASTDLLSLSALETSLGNQFTTLQKRGYISSYSFTVQTTQAGVRLGHAAIGVTFAPANELVQLSVTVGATQNVSTAASGS